MISELWLPKYFWPYTIDNACHILNMIVSRPTLEKTPYELLKGPKSNISYIHVFGCKLFILNIDKDMLSNFNAKADFDIFLGYSFSSNNYRVFNHMNSINK